MCKTECAREMARGREGGTYTDRRGGVNERVGETPWSDDRVVSPPDPQKISNNLIDRVRTLRAP